MRILHCCLAAFYIDNYGYQENIMPRMHKLQGHDVMILASTETYVDNMNLGYIQPKEYVNEDGIPVHRIPYKKFLPLKLMAKLRYYKRLYEELDKFSPDMIFMHDAQFMSIPDVVKYLKKHPEVHLNVDSHTDLKNSARSFLSRRILHGLLYKHCLKRIEPFVSNFFGTLPNRVDFLTDVYGMPKEKVKLLVMGADDGAVEKAKSTGQRDLLRAKYQISEKTILIVSGGKFDANKKEILYVMDAVKGLSSVRDIKMLVFGSVSEKDGFDEAFMSRCDGNIIQYAGWIKSNESYNYFEASDIVIFPGLHSVLWEQAVGQGKPCIFRYIPGQTHIDVGGNCVFLKQLTVSEIKDAINEVLDNYNSFAQNARTKGLMNFSYSEISKKALM